MDGIYSPHSVRVQLSFTPHILVFYCICCLRYLFLLTTSLKRHIKYFNFRCKIQLDHPVVSFPQIALNFQMLHNLQQSLAFLAGRGVAVEEVSASDVHQGNLKAILGLFFQLSRYKQQQKQIQMQQQQVSKMCMQLRWLSKITGRMGLMAHRKWKEIKQQPGTAGSGNMLGCCLLSFHFLWAIHPIRPVEPGAMLGFVPARPKIGSRRQI